MLTTTETNMQKAHENAPIMMVSKASVKGKGKRKGKKKIGSKTIASSKRALNPTGGVAKGKVDKGYCHYCHKQGH